MTWNNEGKLTVVGVVSRGEQIHPNKPLTDPEANCSPEQMSAHTEVRQALDWIKKVTSSEVDNEGQSNDDDNFEADGQTGNDDDAEYQYEDSSD